MNESEIQETRVLWDTTADILYVWDSASKAWKEFAAAADLVSSDDLSKALAKKLDKTGGAVTGSLSVGNMLTVSGDGSLGGTLSVPQITLNTLALTAADGTLYAGGARLWGEGNDGSGSGLDADMLDGRDSGYFTDIPSRLGYTPFNAAGGTIAGNTAITGTLSVSGAVTLSGAVSLSGGGRLLSQRWFYTSDTWMRPDGVRYVLVYCLGAGGGGGGAAGATSAGACGGGGGAGGLAVKFIDVSSLSAATVTVGSAGTAGSSAGGSGGSGGTTSFGSYCSADGGSGGTGQSAGTYAQCVSGGYGGSGTGGDFNFTGAAGAPGVRLDYQNGHGGNGAPAALFGGGGAGFVGNAAGQAGYARGDGGGGATVANSATGQGGGAGGSGLIWVWEFQ